MDSIGLDKKTNGELSDYIIRFRKNHRGSTPWALRFQSIKQRCGNSKNTRYKYYGGKGVECRITADELKKLFIRDEAWKMDRPSVDRIDSDDHYRYGNVRWLEFKENCGYKKYRAEPWSTIRISGLLAKRIREAAANNSLSYRDQIDMLVGSALKRRIAQ